MHNAINMVLSRAIHLVTTPDLVYDPQNWLALAGQQEAVNKSFKTVEAAIERLNWIPRFEELIERLRAQIREQEALNRVGTPRLPPPQVELQEQDAEFDFEAPELQVAHIEADAGVEVGFIQMNQQQNIGPRNQRDARVISFFSHWLNVRSLDEQLYYFQR